MRAAMVGGTAYYAGKRGQESAQREADQEARLQQLEYQQAPPAPPPAPAAAPTGGPTDIAAKLTELKTLMDQGVLTPDEFQAAKAKLLAG
jgi:hypothetical protein